MVQFAFDGSKSVRRMLRDAEPSSLKAYRAKLFLHIGQRARHQLREDGNYECALPRLFVYLLADRGKRAVLVPTVVPLAVSLPLINSFPLVSAKATSSIES